jgi:hypothetical protein
MYAKGTYDTVFKSTSELSVVSWSTVREAIATGFAWVGRTNSQPSQLDILSHQPTNQQPNANQPNSTFLVTCRRQVTNN